MMGGRVLVRKCLRAMVGKFSKQGWSSYKWLAIPLTSHSLSGGRAPLKVDENSSNKKHHQIMGESGSAQIGGRDYNNPPERQYIHGI